VGVKDSSGSLPGSRSAAAAVCWRAVSAGFVHLVRRHAIAVRPVNKRRGTGGAGGRPGVIAPAATANSGGKRKVGVIGNVSNRRPRRSAARQRPRASAQVKFPKNLRAAPVTAPAATSSSSCCRARPSSISVRPPAVRHYDGCGNEKFVARNAGGGACDRAGASRDRRV